MREEREREREREEKRERERERRERERERERYPGRRHIYYLTLILIQIIIVNLCIQDSLLYKGIEDLDKSNV